MSFTRTIAGMNNSIEFISVDVIAYCEGGEITSREAFENGEYSNFSQDIIFWRSISRLTNPEIKIRFRPVSCKIFLNDISQKIIEGNIYNYIAFRDRDWDNYTEELYLDKRIAYTTGYAWENHVTKLSHIAEAIIQIGDLNPDRYENIYQAASVDFNRFMHIIKYPLYMDILTIKSEASFLPKNNQCGGVIELSNSRKSIKFNRKILIDRFKIEKKKFIKERDIDISNAKDHDNLPAHISFDLAKSIISKHISILTNATSVSAKSIHISLINAFTHELTRDVHDHREIKRRVFEAITAASSKR